MNRLRSFRRHMFDVRPGEHLRTWAMFFYLMFVLFAYYILKPVSRGMFLTKFDVDKLPQLYILIAAFGGVLAYLYSRIAVKSSLRTAVFWTMLLSVASLIGIWFFIHLPWMVYVLNIWVGLFSIILVSQGWLVASNLFDAREAKRLYPLLGTAMVLGAAFGGEFTNRTAMLVGARNLLLASAVMVAAAYASFRVAITQAPAKAERARAAQAEEAEFGFGEIMRDIGRVRHLQVIVAILVVTYLVDTLVEYQFQAMARAGHTGDQLTAFFGQFYGLYLNLTEFIFQLFLTAAVVNRFGVGGTLQISPWSVALSSIAAVASPSVLSASAVRLTEASTRYTLNRTGMELLYMPLPLELRNRIKAFIDICVDRFSRGLGGVLLILLTTSVFHLGVKGIAVVVMCLCAPWILLAHVARKEYIATVRKRLEARRLDFEEVRINASDRATLRLLEETASGDRPRPAAYAVSLLAQAEEYKIRPLFERLLLSPYAEVRDAAFAGALRRHDGVFLNQAQLAIRAAQSGQTADFPAAAVPYAIALAPGRAQLAAELLDGPNPSLANGVLEALRDDQNLARQLLTREWIRKGAESDDPARRALATRAAGVLRDRADVFWLASLLNDPRLRGEAIVSLSAYGDSICGALSDMLLDETLPARVRRQIPRVLKNIPAQRSVDALLTAIGHEDLSIRGSALKALNRLRESSPDLHFENGFVTEQIMAEARRYYELLAALAPFQGEQARLLARSLDYRLKATLERLFRLLGLRYPPKEIYNVYRAVSRDNAEEHTAAIEFLDATLDRNLKRILIPLLDAPETGLERGRELFGVEPLTAEEAIRELIHLHDPWLTPCAMAAAAELKLRSLAPEIAKAAGSSEGEMSEVAKSAEAALAA